MASNVFGNPITDATLQAMPEYTNQEAITAMDRARVAWNMKNAQGKDVNARTFVENLKRQWGTGVSTLCLFYNATGNTLRHVASHDWYGHIGPSPYPAEIANGQWGAFLHVKEAGAASGSNAMVVYRGINGEGAGCDWMTAWDNPWGRMWFDNKAYCEIREAGHYDGGRHRGYISGLVNRSGKTTRDTWNGCFSIVTTGSDTSPVLEATFSLENV